MNANVKYCCESFEESVIEGKIMKSENMDETEWYFPEWLHIYYCPFCGANIKGEGYGEVSSESDRLMEH